MTQHWFLKPLCKEGYIVLFELSWQRKKRNNTTLEWTWFKYPFCLFALRCVSYFNSYKLYINHCFRGDPHICIICIMCMSLFFVCWTPYLPVLNVEFWLFLFLFFFFTFCVNHTVATCLVKMVCSANLILVTLNHDVRNHPEIWHGFMFQGGCQSVAVWEPISFKTSSLRKVKIGTLHKNITV